MRPARKRDVVRNEFASLLGNLARSKSSAALNMLSFLIGALFALLAVTAVQSGRVVAAIVTIAGLAVTAVLWFRSGMAEGFSDDAAGHRRWMRSGLRTLAVCASLLLVTWIVW